MSTSESRGPLLCSWRIERHADSARRAGRPLQATVSDIGGSPLPGRGNDPVQFFCARQARGVAFRTMRVAASACLLRASLPGDAEARSSGRLACRDSAHSDFVACNRRGFRFSCRFLPPDRRNKAVLPNTARFQLVHMSSRAQNRFMRDCEVSRGATVMQAGLRSLTSRRAVARRLCAVPATTAVLLHSQLEEATTTAVQADANMRGPVAFADRAPFESREHRCRLRLYPLFVSL